MIFTGILLGAVLFLLGYGRAQTLPLAALCALPCLLAAVFRGHGHHHGAFLSIDQHAQRSRLNGRNPAVKALFAAGCAVLCVAADSPALSAYFFASMLALTVAVGGTPLRYYLRLLTVPALFILAGALAILLEISPAPDGVWNLALFGRYATVTAAGQLRALSVIARAFGAVSCLYMLSLSTPLHEIIGVLRRARIPDVVVELMYLVYRYIFVLLESYENMKTAAGARFGYRGWRAALQTSLQNARNLLFLSFRRSSDCFAAMESRCYDGEIRFLERTAPARWCEAVFVAGYLAVAAAVWITEYLL